MKLISFANNNHGGLVNLKNSLQPGWDLIVVGQGEIWKGWPTRMKIIYKWLSDYLSLEKKNSLKDDLTKNLIEGDNELTENIIENVTEGVNENLTEVVVLCDAYDVLCLRPSSEFLMDFYRFNAEIVISAESFCFSNCFPINNWHNVHKNNSEQKFCNAGLMCGTIRSLTSLFQWLVEKGWEDDQVGIAHYMDSLGVNQMSLDFENRLFYNDNFGNRDYSINANGITTRDEKIITPYFIHFPGMNVLHSVTWFHLFSPSQMFQTGENYNIVGTFRNGVNHIEQNMPDKKLYQITLWSERTTYLVLVFLLIIKKKSNDNKTTFKNTIKMDTTYYILLLQFVLFCCMVRFPQHQTPLYYCFLLCTFFASKNKVIYLALFCGLALLYFIVLKH